MVITLRHSRFDQDQVYKSFRDKREFLDLKLCSDSSKERFISGHRIIVGAVSSVWKKQFLKCTNVENPIVVKNIKHDILVQIVDYIYNGKIVISEDDFEDFSDAYRMINLRLGSQSDKKMYEDNSDGENDLHDTIVVEENSVTKTTATSAPMKRITTFQDSFPNSSTDGINLGRMGDDNSGAKKQPHHLHPLLQPRQPHPLLQDDQVLVSSTTSWGPKVKRIRMSPEQLDTVVSSRGVALNTTKQLDDAASNNAIAAHASKQLDGNNKEVGPGRLRKGPGGHYWIRIERNNINVDAVADTCRRFGQILQLVHLPHLPHVVHVAFKTEEAVNNSIKILNICGYPNCSNTSILPSRFNLEKKNTPTVCPPLPASVCPPLPPSVCPPLPPTAALTAPPPLPPTVPPPWPLTASPPRPPTASPPQPPTASPPRPPTASPPLPPTASPPRPTSVDPPVPPNVSSPVSPVVYPPLPSTSPGLPPSLPSMPPPLPSTCPPLPPTYPLLPSTYPALPPPLPSTLENIAERAKQYAKDKGYIRKG